MERLNFQIQGIASIRGYPSKIFTIARTYTNQFKTQVSYKSLPSEPLKANHKAKI